jgi:hypothetical protein
VGPEGEGGGGGEGEGHVTVHKALEVLDLLNKLFNCSEDLIDRAGLRDALTRSGDRWVSVLCDGDATGKGMRSWADCWSPPPCGRSGEHAQQADELDILATELARVEPTALEILSSDDFVLRHQRGANRRIRNSRIATTLAAALDRCPEAWAALVSLFEPHLHKPLVSSRLRILIDRLQTWGLPTTLSLHARLCETLIGISQRAPDRSDKAPDWRALVTYVERALQGRHYAMMLMGLCA